MNGCLVSLTETYLSSEPKIEKGLGMFSSYNVVTGRSRNSLKKYFNGSLAPGVSSWNNIKLQC